MKPRYEMNIKMYKERLEITGHGELDESDIAIIFDQLANALKLGMPERFMVGAIISGGGIAKMMGRDYGTTVSVDSELLETLPKGTAAATGLDALL